ncbi:MAG: SIR2 family protein [Rickettsiales bacterium]
MISLMKEDGCNTPNIEDILTQVRALASVAGKGTVRGFVAKDLETLDTEICTIISEEVNKSLPDSLSPYHNLAIWTRTIERDKPVHIFTTNYDLLIEQSFEESSAPYFDGFVGSRKAFFDLGAVENEHVLPPRWTRYWKIHGSINWRLDAKKNVVRSDDLAKDNHHLIYPSHLKYDQSRKMPYLAMLDRLKDFMLKQSSILFISGYSFSDDHINDVLCRCLESNSTGMAYAFIFGKLEDEKYKKARECSFRTPNLSLLAFDGAVIGRNKGNWSYNDDMRTNIPEGIVSPLPKESEDEQPKCEVRLGDFLQFSNLLKGLSGADESDE